MRGSVIATVSPADAVHVRGASPAGVVREGSWHAFPVTEQSGEAVSVVSADYLRTVRLRVVQPDVEVQETLNFNIVGGAVSCSRRRSGAADPRTSSASAAAVLDALTEGARSAIEVNGFPKPSAFDTFAEKVRKDHEERVFHIHDTILRAYAPTLATRLDALRPRALPPEELAAVKSLALAVRSQRLEGRWKHGREAHGDEKAAVLTSDCILPPLEDDDVEEKQELEVELVIEGNPIFFGVAVDWMYGTDLHLTYAEMTKWADEGCELLAAAQELGIDALEYALRRAIYEAPVRGGPPLAWAMLQVCDRHGLQRELEQACRVIARTGGFSGSKTRLCHLSVGALSALMASKAWIVEDEEELLAIVDYWVDFHIQEELGEHESETAAMKAKKDAVVDSLRLVEHSGRWDVKWGAFSRHRLDRLAHQSKLVPYALLLDCVKWLDLMHGGQDEHQSRSHKVQKEQAETSKNQRSKEDALLLCEEAFERAQVYFDTFDAKQQRFDDLAEIPLNLEGEPMSTTALTEVIVDARKALHSLRMQVAVAKNAVNKAEEASVVHEASEPCQTYKGRIRLSEAVLEWRRQGLSQGPQSSHAKRFLAGTIKRRRPPRVRKDEDGKARVDADAADVVVGDVEERFISSYCPWLRRRRCHHAVFQNPSKWRDRFSSILVERDRTVIRMLPPKPIVHSADDVHHVAVERWKKAEMKVDERRRTHVDFGVIGKHPQGKDVAEEPIPGVPLFVGQRLFRQGRHEMLIRVARQRGTDGEVPELNGFRFGIAMFDLEQPAPEDNSSDEEGEVKKPKRKVTELTLKDNTGRIADKQRRASVKTTFRDQPANERAKTLFARKVPNMLLRVTNEEKLNEMVHDVDTVKAGAVIDLVILISVEACKLRWAAEQVVCASAESSDFLMEHKFLDNWSDEQKLEEDLKVGIHHEPPQNDQIMYAFFMEIGDELYDSAGEKGSVFVEVLPQEALRRSWWVDLMDRSADGQPHYGEGPQNWGTPVSRLPAGM